MHVWIHIVEMFLILTLFMIKCSHKWIRDLKHFATGETAEIHICKQCKKLRPTPMNRDKHLWKS